LAASQSEAHRRMTAPAYWKRATRELSASDPVIAALVRQFAGLALHSRGDAFHTLARSIVGQQISVKAADSVWQKLMAALPVFHPGAVHALDAEVLRACGLSRGKVTYLQDLARHFLERTVAVESWHDLDDETLIEQLTRVRGIGRWTAEMFLIFYLARPNVFPVDDLGLQRAMRLHYNRGKPLSARRINTIARRWLPWRSVATWYMWRSLDPVPVEY
jgi:DNA-3-methyladenine glycosylase II